MWTIIKIDKKKINFLKSDLAKKIGNDFKVYVPKLRIQKFKQNKLTSKEIDLLGDYIFCFHKKFSCKLTIESLKFMRGLKYFLDGFSWYLQ